MRLAVSDSRPGGNYIRDIVHDGVGFVSAEVAAAAFVECARGFEVEDAAAAAAAVAAAEPAFGPCQLQPVPTAPPRPDRAGGPRAYAICQAPQRLTDQRRRLWSAGACHHVSVSGPSFRFRHRRRNRAHLLHSLIQIVFLDHSAARHTAAAKFRRPSVARGVTDSPSDDARPSPSVQWVALKLFLPARNPTELNIR